MPWEKTRRHRVEKWVLNKFFFSSTVLTTVYMWGWSNEGIGINVFLTCMNKTVLIKVDLVEWN
jgi:hypothetical protein